MNPGKSPRPADTSDEISALIETLHQTGQRLEELTAGEVDAVADRDGRTFLLRHAQEQLRHSEAAKQAAILNALPAHIALLDTQGVIISVNEAWRRFAGANALQNPQCGVGVNYLDVCDSARGADAAEAQQAAAGIRSVLAGTATSFSIEYPCHSPAEQRWFLLTVIPLADDRLHGAVVMHMNITERKRAEEALRESEARFRSLTAMSSDFYWESDAEHRLTARASADKKVSAVSVFQKGAQIGERRWEIPHLSPDEAGWTAHRAMLDAHLPFRDFELSRRGVDGEERHISVSGDPVFDASGAFKGYRGVGADITERKRGERLIRDSEKRFRTIFDQAPIGMALLDKQGRPILSNAPLSNMLGYSNEELSAMTFDEFTYLEDVDKDRNQFTDLMAGKISTYRMEKRYVHKNGNLIWANLFVTVLRDENGLPQDVIGMVEDITERKHAEKHLVQMEGRYRGLLEAAPDAMVVVNQVGEIVLLNLQAEKQFGYRRDELVGQKVKNIIPEGFAERLVADGLRSTAEALAQQIGTGIALTGRRKGGSDFPIEIMLSPLESAEGILVTAAIRDITARKATENRISRLNRVYAVLSGINTLIVRTRDRQELFDETCRIAVEQGQFRLAWIGLLDGDGVDVTLVSRAGVDEGYLDNIQLTARDDAPGRCEMLTRALREKTVVVCNDIDTDPQMARWREEALRRGYRSVVVFPLQFADKVSGALLLYASEKDFFDTQEMTLLAELAGDVSFAIDHLDKQERLDYLAYYDVLTGLANRSLFLERVTQYTRVASRGGHKLAVFLIDLERFKNINDGLGRTAGDALLRQVAEWLTRSVGDACLLARVGADHFAVVLPEVRQDGDLARFLEKRMDEFLAHPFQLNDAVFRIAVKIGGALFPEDGADADTLFRNAEAALKKAKASGQRYLFYTQKMTDSVAGKLSLENQLRLALDDEEFVLHYQPKVNLVSGKVTSAEALIRWNDPRTGLVPPGRFIPILEETGMIYDVGRWALKKAIEDYLRWRAAGLPAVRIAVNVSALQLRNRGFIEEIRQVIGIDAQAPAGLELEITESLIMADVKGTITSLQAIRALGVSVAIDDFGTGFSSLAYLAKLPMDALKIDRSFVLDMTTAPEGLALVSTIIKLAHSLKLAVVAEGVETEEQARLLRLLACEEMQGFLVSKPVPAEIFETRFLVPLPALG